MMNKYHLLIEDPISKSESKVCYIQNCKIDLLVHDSSQNA